MSLRLDGASKKLFELFKEANPDQKMIKLYRRTTKLESALLQLNQQKKNMMIDEHWQEKISKLLTDFLLRETISR